MTSIPAEGCGFLEIEKFQSYYERLGIASAFRRESAAIVKCSECLREFFGNACYENHRRDGTYKAKNKSICSIIKICSRCQRCIHLHKGNHECGLNWCKICKEKHSPNDFCYMAPVKDDDGSKKKKTLYIFNSARARSKSLYCSAGLRRLYDNRRFVHKL